MENIEKPHSIAQSPDTTSLLGQAYSEAQDIHFEAVSSLKVVMLAHSNLCIQLR